MDLAVGKGQHVNILSDIKSAKYFGIDQSALAKNIFCYIPQFYFCVDIYSVFPAQHNFSRTYDTIKFVHTGSSTMPPRLCAPTPLPFAQVEREYLPLLLIR